LKKNNQKFIYKATNDSNIKRTVLVDYLIERKDFKTNNQLLEYYECSAKNNDTLDINIGIQGGLGGYGFHVLYKDKNFKIRPYNYSDQNRSEKDKFEVSYQNLVLDKLHYNSGDSIYGKVDFKVTEIQNKLRTTYTGKASFATKVSD